MNKSSSSRERALERIAAVLTLLVASLLLSLVAGVLSPASPSVGPAALTPVAATTSVIQGYDGRPKQAGTHAQPAGRSPLFERSVIRERAAGLNARSAAEAELPAGYSSFKAAKTGMGPPGTGNVFDHVVEQSQIGRSGFSPQEIHNPFNMNPVSAGTNQLKANYYSAKRFFTEGGTVRDWLTEQRFADQYEFGMDVLRRIENGVPLR